MTRKDQAAEFGRLAAIKAFRKSNNISACLQILNHINVIFSIYM
jgi:hypothetical protein